MSKVKFLHCADIHLDTPFTSLESSEGISSMRRQDLKETFQRIIEVAKTESVDLILISGDLYEHNYVKKSTIHFINDLFRGISEIKVVIVPGNHDPFIVNSFYKSYPWSDNVCILTQDNPYILYPELEVCVYGVGFQNFFEEKPLEYNIKPIYPEYINMILVHGTVDMNFKQSVYNATTSENLHSLHMDYVALGHFHNRIDNVGGYGTIYNPGSPEPLGFDETGEHGVYLGTVTKENERKSERVIQFVKVCKKFYENIELQVNGCNTNEQIISQIESILANDEEKKKNGLFSITLKGYVESGFKIEILQLLSYFRGQVCYLKVKDETTADYNFEEILQEPGLRGLFARKIFSKIELTEDEYEKKLLIKALYFGIEALEKGSVEIN